MKSREVAKIPLATLVLLGQGLLGAISAKAIIPLNGGQLVGTTITINNGLGDQYDPHVSGDLSAYTSTELWTTVRYYNFLTGADAPIPSPSGAVDLLPDV